MARDDAASSREVETVLTAALRGKLSKRDLAMIGYSPETKQAITGAIEVNPAMEDTFLLIAELAYADGTASN